MLRAMVIIGLSGASMARSVGATPSACVSEIQRAELAAAGVFPGRTWTWRMDAERSRERLTTLRRELTDLSNCGRTLANGAGAAQKSGEQKSTLKRELELMHARLQHIEADAASLDRELRNDNPTRWLVQRDVADMQREIRGLARINARLAAALASHD
jgi:predicted RNase H-like nuclease (RuvC/YqgF family)